MFDRVSLSVVLVNGLADGINPCAFTTLVFLVSFLQHEGISRTRVLLAGIGYVGAVYVTYFALLAGAMGAFRYAEGFRWVGVGVSVLAIGMSLWFAALHLRDLALLARTGKTSEMAASLPRPWVARVHEAIRSGLRSRTLLLGAAAAGSLVAVIESACTGQVALPTVAYIVKMDGSARTVAAGVGWLLLYVTAFILPLFVVFGAALAGLSSARLAAWARAHFALSKLLLAIVLLWFALVLGILVWKELA